MALTVDRVGLFNRNTNSITAEVIVMYAEKGVDWGTELFKWNASENQVHLTTVNSSQCCRLSNTKHHIRCMKPEEVRR